MEIGYSRSRLFEMPLIDDRTRGNEPRPAAHWPWVIVVAGLSLLWVLIAVVSSLLTRYQSRKTSGTMAIQQVNTQALQSAQQMAGYGSYPQAAALIQNINTVVPMSTSDKHTYFRIGAQSLMRTGQPAASAEFYDRFLSFGAHIHEKECAGCHNAATSIAPRAVADMEKSSLGAGYVKALRKAATLEQRYTKLAAEWKKQPKDPRLNLLLYHLETARKRPAEAKSHATAIASFDKSK